MPRRSWVVLAVGVTMLAVACEPALSDAERRWAEEVTGATARLNDITALEVVPALAQWDGPVDPDFDRMLSACERMEPATVELGNAVSDPPPRFEDLTPLTNEVFESWMRLARDCQAAAGARDVDALQALSTQFSQLGTLSRRLGSEFPKDIQCPERLKAEIETCRVG